MTGRCAEPAASASLWLHRVSMVMILPWMPILAVLVVATFAIGGAVGAVLDGVPGVWRHGVQSWKLGWRGE